MKCWEWCAFLSSACINTHILQVSRDEETIRFDKPVVLDDKLVETWLSVTEEAMRTTLHDLMSRALLEYNRIPLLEWAESYPSQVTNSIVFRGHIR